MSKRNRGRFHSAIGIATLCVIFALACLTAWDFASSYTRHAVQAEIQASGYADTTEQKIARSCPSPATTECIASVVEASHEQQRSEADLNAQRDMAKWAFAMVIVSAAGTCIGLLGLLFIADTLRATRKGNKISRRIGEAQVRAYLTATKAAAGPARKDSMTGGPQIKLWVQNSGATPAVNVSYFCRVDTTIQFSRNVMPQLKKVPFDQFLGSIPAGAERDFEAMAFGLLMAFSAFTEASKETDPENTPIGKYPLMVLHGVIFYDDVFGKSYRSSFAFLMDHPDYLGPLDVVQASIPTFVAIDSRDEHREPKEGA